ncbi:hypothetical protein SAMN06269173_111111 [Hymenobacter mucosus]|uniref:Uncharacterized protein n=1 Tax=Hymenobacter mucosus TaxID=1411120 RepID=A0A239ACL3_9BACT|nr:hypothetical protein SAMN06269173_111111 [Hymenobacter mucosus]
MQQYPSILFADCLLFAIPSLRERRATLRQPKGAKGKSKMLVPNPEHPLVHVRLWLRKNALSFKARKELLASLKPGDLVVDLPTPDRVGTVYCTVAVAGKDVREFKTSLTTCFRNWDSEGQCFRAEWPKAEQRNTTLATMREVLNLIVADILESRPKSLSAALVLQRYQELPSSIRPIEGEVRPAK